MKIIYLTILVTLLNGVANAQLKPLVPTTQFDTAIAVLNMGSFHMGFTTDASKTEFDEHDVNNVKQVHDIARKIAAFKPTVILVETTPGFNERLQAEYQQYLKTPGMKFSNPSEIELLAYEIGRLSKTSRIYGVDYKEGYDYMIGNRVANSPDAKTARAYMQMVNNYKKLYPEDKMEVLDNLRICNHPQYLDMLMNVNADMLTHISSPGKWEGADEAAKFYHRNLVMYSNINQVPLTKNDRVFILMGATHTAFFNMWFQRSPKYKLVNVFDYLK
jgi:hypothetical protein